MKNGSRLGIIGAAAALAAVIGLAVWFIGESGGRPGSTGEAVGNSGRLGSADGIVENSGRLGSADGIVENGDRPESADGVAENDGRPESAGGAWTGGRSESTGGVESGGRPGSADAAGENGGRGRGPAVITVTTAAADAPGSVGGSSRADGGSGNGAGGSGGPAGTGEDESGSAAGAGGASFGDITLLFGGDVYFSDHVMRAYEKAGGIGGVLDEGIRAEIDGADIFMVNQEFPFTDRGSAAADKQFTFRVPPEKVSMFREMGIDIVTMANNHILDFGPEGITDSLAALDGAGILHVGAGENLEQAGKPEIIEVKGKKIGFLGASRVYMASSWAAGEKHPGVFSTYDPAPVLEAIREARALCDYLVVYVHWGIERNTEPETYQRTMGRQYIDAGADLVVGSHPHVLQEIEYYNGKPIVYSLGNFVFGSSIPETELLKVVLKETEDGGGIEITVIPCTSSGGYTRLQ